MRFWDSSALVSLLVEEPSTDELLELYGSEDVVVWWGSETECASALARLERTEQIGRSEVAEAFKRLQALAAAWHQVEPVDRIKTHAQRLLRAHDLRAADSVQLAAAVLAAEDHPPSLEFVCRDERLSLAASREGFSVL